MMHNLLFQVAMAGSFVVSATMLMLWRSLRRHERLQLRLTGLRGQSGTVSAPRPQESALPVRFIAAIGTTIARSGLLSTRTLTELEQTLITAGLRGRNGLALFVGSKLLLLLGLPLVALAVLPRLLSAGLMVDIGVMLFGVVGLLGPDFAVRTVRKRYLKQLQGGLADALDMMVICSEAGLTLESTIGRVATEIHHAHPAISRELVLTAQELRISVDSRTALTNAGVRTGLDGIKRLASTLIQTMQYGTPLSQALRTLSTEMRQETLTRFEARAARLPVLLTVPMIVFILPCVFLIVGGPAAIRTLAMMNQ